MLFPLYDENPTRRFPFVTVTIIVVNVLCLLYMNALANDRQGDLRLRVFVHQHGFVPARLQQLVDPQPLLIELYPAAPQVRLAPLRPVIKLEARKLDITASLITAMFLHAGWLHLLSNMWFLWLFGNNIEDRLGHVCYLLFYLFGGVTASLVHSLAVRGPDFAQPVIGASGAVAVMLGAYAVFYPFARVRTLVVIIIFITFFDVPAVLILGLWFVGQLLSGLQPAVPGMGVNVAWWAHIGGFLVGVGLMPLLASMIPGPASQWTQRPPWRVGGHHQGW